MDEHEFSEYRKHNKKADIISRLPDEILCEILSCFPTKFAVTTSVFSKRWNRIWTSVPILDFTDAVDDGDDCGFNYRTKEDRTRFFNFVDRVLTLNTVSSLHRIALHCDFDDDDNDDEDADADEDCDSSRVSAWISSIATRESSEFCLALPRWCLIQNLDQSSRIYSLPDCFFTRKNLVVTLLLKHVALKVPTLVDFPCLKTMYLCSVQLLDDVSMKNLISGCQILDLLRINRTCWDNTRTVYVCSSTLHHLTLFTRDYSREFGYNVVIDAPKLRSIYLSDERGVDYDIVDVSSLVEAKVDIQIDEDTLIDVEAFNARLFQLLRKISHVEDLCFTDGTMRSFNYARIENMPMFKNMTSMRVDLCEEGFTVFSFLFHCAPKLVNFILEKVDENHTCMWYEPDEVPQCFSSSLEFVKIEYFEQCDGEFGFISYILKNALKLKKFSINSLHYNLEVETNIRKQLLSFQKSSSVCEIEYKNER